MATVIDALVVSLGLDAKGFSTSARDASSAMDGVKKSAEETGEAMEEGGKKSEKALEKTDKKAEKTGKSIAHSGANASEFFSKMRNQALAFFAVLTAGKSLKAFVSDTVASDASLGRASRRLNIAKKDVYALQKAVESVGGSGDAATASIQNIQNAMTDPQQSAQLMQKLSQLGVTDGIDAQTGQIKDVNKFYQNLAENRNKLANAPRVALLQDSYFDQGSIDLILKGKDAVKSTFSTYEEYGKKIAANADEAERLQAKYNELVEQNRAYAQELEGDLLPALTNVTTALSDFEKLHPKLTKDLMEGSLAVAGFGAAILGVLSIVGGMRFLRALKSIERLAEAAKKGGAVEKAEKTVEKAEKGAEGIAEAEGGAEAAAPVASKASKAARIARIAGRALGGLNLAGDAYLAGDLFWNGASPSLAKDDTTNAPKKLLLAKLEKQYGLPRGLLDAMWAKESSRGRNAGTSSAGALGDFQIMPAVAAEAGIDPRNFEQAATYAAKRMSHSMGQYNGSLAASLADYNWGGGNLRKDVRRNGGDWVTHAPAETQDYIASISQAVASAQQAPRGGYSDAQPSVNHTTVSVGEIHVTAPNPERAGVAVQQRLMQLGNNASQANMGVS